MSMMTVKEAAAKLDVNDATVRNWISKGYLNASKARAKHGFVLMIDEKDLYAFQQSDKYIGHPEAVKPGIYHRIPDIERCYPVNLICAVLEVKSEPEDEIKSDIIWNVNIPVFKEFLTRLNDQEQKVIELRFHVGFTLDETGAVLGVTKERIRQVEIKALRKMRYYIRGGSCFTVLKKQYTELEKAYQILQNKYETLLAFALRSEPIDEEQEVSLMEQMSKIGIEELDLSIRSYNCLKRAGLNTVGDLIEYDTNQDEDRAWLNIRNLGRRSLEEVAKKVYTLCGYRIGYYDGHQKKITHLVPIAEIDSDEGDPANE